MKEKEIVICRDCGEKITGESVEIDGEHICQKCFDENYFYCDDCGKIECRDYGYWISSEEKMVCDNCISHYTLCSDCEEYYPNSEMYHVHGFYDDYVCEDCLNNGNYGYCEGCGEYYSFDNMHYSERNDQYYCEDCYDDYDEDLLYSYHSFDDWEMFNGKDEKSAPYYIGKEIELEPVKNYCLEEVVELMNRTLNAVGMEDGSLNSGGIEVVTQPESWNYLLENKQKYIDFFDGIEHLGYGNDGHCGLHFHVSRPNENVISRIIVLLESFKDEIKKLSRRNGRMNWSKFITDDETDEKEKIKYQSTKYVKDKYINKRHDRYMALNLNNENTIEFRFFNGANNFEEFWGALQFIHNIMEVALDETRSIDTIEWIELIKGDELIEQAIKQQVLGINKKAKDTSEIVEKLENIKEQTKEEIKKALKNFIRYITKELEEQKLEFINRNDIDYIEKTGHDYVNNLSNNLNYLENITSLYKNVDYNSLNTTKNITLNIKDRYEKSTKYDRYFKQIEKALNKYESEVIE